MLARMKQLWSRLSGLVKRDGAEDEMNRELAAHVALFEDEARRRGMTAEEARRAARVALGGIEQTKELHREARSYVWISDAWRDAGYAMRVMRRNPSVTITAVLSLALAIGANTAGFTVANALLFRAPAGVSEPDRLVDIGIGRPDGGFNPTSNAVYEHLCQTATTLDGIYGRPMFPSGLSFTTGSEGPVERVHGQFVTSNYFEVLGVRAATGSVFTAADAERPDAALVAVIGTPLWRSRFASDPAIAGKVMRLNGQPFTITGVAPEGFQGAGIVSADLWLPMGAQQALRAMSESPVGSQEPALDGGWMVMGARLKAGVSVARAATEVDAIGQALDRRYSKQPGSRTLRLVSASAVPGNQKVVAAFMAAIMVMMLLILLVACTNVSGVLLARAAARRREMAVRLSIGAGRARLIRQLLTETILLFAIGGTAGVVLARLMNTLFARSLPSLPFPVNVSLPVDYRVLAFTSGLSLLAALVFGLAPALQASKFDSANALKDDAQGRRSRLRALFIVAQVACSITLVVTGALFVRALQHAGSASQGFDPRGIELVSIDLTMARYTDGTAPTFWRELLERTNRLPGVERAVLGRVTPGGFESIRFSIGAPAAKTANGDFVADGNIVSPGYFATMRIPLLAGRDFNDADMRGAEPIVIVSEAVAKHYWPGDSAVGNYLSEQYGPDTGKRYRVVGVVRDIFSSSLIDGLSQAYIYLPLTQQPYTPVMTTTMNLIVRTNGQRRVGDELRSVVTSIDARLPITTTRTIDESIALGQTPQRIVASIAGSLGTAGLLLAAVGVYGLTAFIVTSRTRELGIRLALGARRSQIFRSVLGHGMTLVAIGAVAGLSVAALIGRLLASFLFGLAPMDPIAFGGATTLFAVATLAACYGPARRATRVDPLIALRYE